MSLTGFKTPILCEFFSLFPACAGVILSRQSAIEVCLTFPRMCGGDPNKFFGRGYRCRLFPACAGVILEIENAMYSGLEDIVGRKYLITFWNDDVHVNDYRTGSFYLSDVSYSYTKIKNGTLYYDAITYTFVEY